MLAAEWEEPVPQPVPEMHRSPCAQQHHPRDMAPLDDYSAEESDARTSPECSSAGGRLSAVDELLRWWDSPNVNLLQASFQLDTTKAHNALSGVLTIMRVMQERMKVMEENQRTLEDNQHKLLEENQRLKELVRSREQQSPRRVTPKSPGADTSIATSSAADLETQLAALFQLPPDAMRAIGEKNAQQRTQILHSSPAFGSLIQRFNQMADIVNGLVEKVNRKPPAAAMLPRHEATTRAVTPPAAMATAPQPTTSSPRSESAPTRQRPISPRDTPSRNSAYSTDTFGEEVVRTVECSATATAPSVASLDTPGFRGSLDDLGIDEVAMRPHSSATHPLPASLPVAPTVLPTQYPFFGIEATDGGELGGVRVVHISPKSPAILAGLQTGDIIVTFDGFSVSTRDEFKTAAACASNANRDIPVVFLKPGAVQPTRCVLAATNKAGPSPRARYATSEEDIMSTRSADGPRGARYLSVNEEERYSARSDDSRTRYLSMSDEDRVAVRGGGGTEPRRLQIHSRVVNSPAAGAYRRVLVAENGEDQVRLIRRSPVPEGRSPVRRSDSPLSTARSPYSGQPSYPRRSAAVDDVVATVHSARTGTRIVY
eukprot:NODE_717_length_2155_cov_53.312992_g683_i0.p1 GENE.NODE_717_length_2155_cov_53.312992_g683_i0~~NODE_717_length_2155_cov_53.312992_g683_i0.p1  ORF type:complete len:600 (+),score=86.45 NODE_717_length_2155_cov_53.312992_g683_i0:139-1938(+)